MVPDPRVGYDRRVRLSVSATLLALGCASPPVPPRPVPAPPTTAPAPAFAPTPDPPPPPAPTGEAPPPSPLPETACRPLGLAKACVSPASHAWLESDAVAAWYQSRGTKLPRNEIEPSCREITLGNEAALWCERIQHESRGKPGTPAHTYRVLTLLSLRVVRNKQALVAFEAPIRFDVLDKEELDQGSLFELVADSKSPLTELVLREPSDGACREAEVELRDRRAKERAENDTVQLAWTRLDEELRARLCRALGTYALRGGRLQRAVSPTTSTSSGP